MISKVKVGAISAFMPCCKYNLQDFKDPQIVTIQGLRYDPISMANDFEINAKQTSNKTKGVLFHSILSFPKDEKISENIANKISKEYLAKLGFSNSPYAVIAHNDKEHWHMHCISSFIDFNGKIVDDSWIGLRAKKVAQQLTIEFGLQPAMKKDYTKTNFKNLRNNDNEKYRLHTIISSAIKFSKSFNQFEKLLSDKNIEIQYKHKRGTDEIQGISFKSGDFCFKGSEVDRDFSYNKILQSIELNIPHQIENSITQESEPRSSVVSDFSSGYVSGGSSISGGIFPTHTSFHNSNIDDEDEINKKKKKKRKSNELNF
jgi:hypothetical protein